MKEQLTIFLKSLAMGAVNPIPGVSSGTVAMITGLFERLINSLKSFSPTAFKLLLKGNFREFAKHTDFVFLLTVVFGNIVAVVSLARILGFLFDKYPIYIWAYFFGLVLASVVFLGKMVEKWRIQYILLFLVGTTIAVFISVGTPGVENDNFWFLMLCGAIVLCCMILPGTSGAFVLLLLGNYHLVMIDAVNNLQFEILIPFILGAVIGVIPFSHGLSWLLKRFRDSTISLLTGFILGSLATLWPWKESIVETFGTKEVTTGFVWNLPQMNAEFAIAVFLCALGVVTIFSIEWIAKKITAEK